MERGEPPVPHLLHQAVLDRVEVHVVDVTPEVVLVKRVGRTALIGGLARVLTFAVPVVIVRLNGLGTETDAFFLAAAVVLFWTTTSGAIVEGVAVREANTAARRVSMLWLAGAFVVLAGAFV